MKMMNQLTLWGITAKTAIVHTLTYFAVGFMAFRLFNYSARFADSAISSFWYYLNLRACTGFNRGSHLHETTL